MKDKAYFAEAQARFRRNRKSLNEWKESLGTEEASDQHGVSPEQPSPIDGGGVAFISPFEFEKKPTIQPRWKIT